MKGILISGGTGLVGMFFTNMLKKRGIKVHHLSRNPKSNGIVPTFKWDIANKFIDENAFEGIDTIVHLAGASVADKRWNTAYKKIMRSSRIDSAKLLIDKIKNLPKNQIKTLVSASAMGIYGNCGNTVLTETAKADTSFMAQLCEDWERASDEVETLGVRRVILRIPLVLEKGEGALEKMELPAKFGVGSYFGNGKQIYSWIHIKDLCRMIEFVIENPKCKGVYNANAPETLSNYNFSKQLNKALNRPFIPAPAPKFALKIALGEFAEALYWSANLSSKKIQETGFTFSFPNLKEAFDDLYV